MEYTYQFPGGITVKYGSSDHTKIMKAFNRKLDEQKKLKVEDIEKRMKTDLLPKYPTSQILYHEVMREHFKIPTFR